MMGMHNIIASESVSPGHPDKVADQISDAVVDHCLEADPQSRVACETLVTTDLVMVAGEVTTTAELTPATIDRLVRETIRHIGYVEPASGFAADSCRVMNFLHAQSADIARGVDVGGAGDQGMMYGLAVTETPSLLPAPVHLAHRLMERHDQVRRSGILPFLRPDAKSQVTVEYHPDGKPLRIRGVVLSTQHDASALACRCGKAYFSDEARQAVIDHIIEPVLLSELPHLLQGPLRAVSIGESPDFEDERTPVYVNPTGCFMQGGPHGDCGLTGRKIIVDTYGGIGRHGGGAFSGKDPTKVDRSGAYIARFLARHVIRAGLAQRCEVHIAYVIGHAQPVGFRVDTFGTAIRVSDHRIADTLRGQIDLTPAAVIRLLGLAAPVYRQTATFGHFGRQHFRWEQDHAPLLDALRAL